MALGDRITLNSSGVSIPTNLVNPVKSVVDDIRKRNRQAKIDAQNKQLFDMRIAEANKALEKEKALEDLNKGLLSLPTTKTGPDRLVKGTPQSAVDAATQRLVDRKLGGNPNVKGDYGAGGVYADEFSRLTTPQNSPKGLPTNYETIQRDDLVAQLGIRSVPVGTGNMSTEEAHKLALQKAGLSDNMEAKDVLTKQEMASLPKATADRIEKGETVSLNDKQMLEAQKNYIRGQVSAGNIPANIGVARLEELEKASKKDDISAATQLSMLRLQRDLKKDEIALQKETQKIAKEAREKADKLNKERLESKDTLNTLSSIFERFGSPDVIGTGDETKIESDVLDLKNKYKLTDNQMSNLLRQVQNKYPATFGVDEDAIVEGLEEILRKR